MPAYRVVEQRASSDETTCNMIAIDLISVLRVIVCAQLLKSVGGSHVET